MAHTVDLDNTFRGPLDLLLYLVKRDEIDIHDIPIARLTRAYLAELSLMPIADVEAGADFLALAAMLTEIKSRMLLPPAETEEDAEGEDELIDPRSGLVAKLQEYLRFKEAAAALSDLAEAHGRRVARFPSLPMFAEPAPVADEAADADEARQSIDDLVMAFQSFLMKALAPAAPDTIDYDQVPTERRIAQIEEALDRLPTTRFSRLLSERPTASEVVGFFIAILELVRQRKLRARQSADFADIVLERREGQELTFAFDGTEAAFSTPPPPPFMPVPMRADERRATPAWAGAYGAGPRDSMPGPLAWDYARAARPSATGAGAVFFRNPTWRLSDPGRDAGCGATGDGTRRIPPFWPVRGDRPRGYAADASRDRPGVEAVAGAMSPSGAAGSVDGTTVPFAPSFIPGAEATVSVADDFTGFMPLHGGFRAPTRGEPTADIRTHPFTGFMPKVGTFHAPTRGEPTADIRAHPFTGFMPKVGAFHAPMRGEPTADVRAHPFTGFMPKDGAFRAPTHGEPVAVLRTDTFTGFMPSEGTYHAPTHGEPVTGRRTDAVGMRGYLPRAGVYYPVEDRPISPSASVACGRRPDFVGYLPSCGVVLPPSSPSGDGDMATPPMPPRGEDIPPTTTTPSHASTSASAPPSPAWSGSPGAMVRRRPGMFVGGRRGYGFPPRAAWGTMAGVRPGARVPAALFPVASPARAPRRPGGPPRFRPFP